MRLVIDSADALCLRNALDEYVDRQHKLAHTARTGGRVEGVMLDAAKRDEYAQACLARILKAEDIIAQLDRLEMAAESERALSEALESRS